MNDQIVNPSFRSLFTELGLQGLSKMRIYSAGLSILCLVPGIVGFLLVAYTFGLQQLEDLGSAQAVIAAVLILLTYILSGAAAGGVLAWVSALKGQMQASEAQLHTLLEESIPRLMEISNVGAAGVDIEALQNLLEADDARFFEPTPETGHRFSPHRWLHKWTIKKFTNFFRLVLVNEFTLWLREKGTSLVTLAEVEIFSRQKLVGRAVGQIDGQVSGIRKKTIIALAGLALLPFLAALGLKFYTQVFPGPYRLLAHYAEQIPLARQLVEYERQLLALQVEPDCLPEKPYTVTKDGFKRTKPHVNVYLMGLSHLDKLALLSAISRVMCGKGLAEYVAIDDMIKHKSELNLGLIDYTGYVEFESASRHYAQAFGYGPIYDVKNLILFMTAVDGAILLVSTATGITPELRNLIRISRQCGINHILVYIDCSIKDLDAQQLNDLTSDTKNLLQQNGYGDRSPIITGSAFRALNGEASAMGMDSIVKLVETMDAHIPEQMMRGHEQPFMMPVEDVFIISGRGLAASGRIKFGRIRVGEEIEIIGFAPPSRAVVSGIQMFRKLLDEGQAGDNIVVIFEDLTRDDIFRGRMLVQPGSMQAVRQFEALVYMMNKDEGGRLIRPAKGFRPQFYFWTTDVTGIVTPPEGVHEFSPGTVYTINVKLIDPVAMNKDTRFAVRVGGRTVGTGKVTNLIMLK